MRTLVKYHIRLVHNKYIIIHKRMSTLTLSPFLNFINERKNNINAASTLYIDDGVLNGFGTIANDFADFFSSTGLITVL